MPVKFLTHDNILCTSVTLPCDSNLSKIAKIRLYSGTAAVKCLQPTTVISRCKSPPGLWGVVDLRLHSSLEDGVDYFRWQSMLNFWMWYIACAVNAVSMARSAESCAVLCCAVQGEGRPWCTGSNAAGTHCQRAQVQSGYQRTPGQSELVCWFTRPLAVNVVFGCFIRSQ